MMDFPPKKNIEADPEYTKAVVQKKPRQNDPLEMAITNKIKEKAFSTEWGRETISDIRTLQINYMREVLQSEEPSFTYIYTQNFLKEVSLLLRARIVEGAELLKEIPPGSSVLVMTNHLGLYKLTGINPKEELGVDILGYDFMYPSPMYFAGLSPIAEAAGDKLSYVSDDFPGVFGEIHRASGFIHVPPLGAQKTNRTEALLEQTRDVFETHPKTAIVNFPEGGTSGKYNGLGPYNLEPFKTGGYVIASKLGIYVIPVAQYFDPTKGLQLKVFPPYIPAISEKDGYEKNAHEDQRRMQEWLGSHESS